MSDPLKPADHLAKQRTPRFAGESAAYAKARQNLIAAEIEARRTLGKLARQIRDLPAGPEIAGDYVFHDANGGAVKLADLFGDQETLVLYHWMYGPERERPCPMCTNLLGPLAANAADIRQRTALAVVSRSSVERQKAFARERGWSDAMPLYQTQGDAFSLAIGGLDPDNGWEMPVLMVLKRAGDAVHLHWMGEITKNMADPGEDPRGAVDLSPLWNVLDLTPEGRAADWYPKLAYN